LVAWGEFHQDGWHVGQPHEDVRTTRFASAHESHHKQLQDSTSFGALARLYHELGVATGLRRFQDTASRLTQASRFVQESFASWMPAAALGWTRADVVERYPEYAYYYDALNELVITVDGPYLRFHAAHALCRVCMQTTAIPTALAKGLEAFSLADLRQRDLPDARAGLLRRHPPDWATAIASLRAQAADNDALQALLSAQSLTADLFHQDLSDLWRHVNQTMYDVAAQALRVHGSISLSLDGHLEQTPALVAEGRRISGRLDLEAGHPRRPSEVLTVVMGNIEAETFSVADPLPARILARETPLPAMVADLHRPHLFVTLRDSADLIANYTVISGELPDDPVSAWARRTVVEADGRRVVELLPIAAEKLPDLDSLTVPVVTVVPMSLLSVPLWRRWAQGSVLRSAAMLVDVALAAYLDEWTSQPDTCFRYAFLRIESFGRVVPFLVSTVETAGATAWPLLLRPLSHAGVGVHQAALRERDPARRTLIQDDGILEAKRDLIELCLAHLAGEEVTFGPGVARSGLRGGRA
jgi:hypothetical protein